MNKITSDLHQRISGSINFTWANNTRNDMERNQLIEMTYKPNSFINFSISYDHYQLKKKYDYTLDYDPEWDASLCAEIDTHYIFSSIDEENDQINMQINWTINRQLSIQTYFDYYSIMKTYDQSSYIEYEEINDEFIYSDYIWGTGEYANYSPFYTDDPESIYDANGDLLSILDPNHYLKKK